MLCSVQRAPSNVQAALAIVELCPPAAPKSMTLPPTVNIFRTNKRSELGGPPGAFTLVHSAPSNVHVSSWVFVMMAKRTTLSSNDAIKPTGGRDPLRFTCVQLVPSKVHVEPPPSIPL